jgi:hypothetical protein
MPRSRLLSSASPRACACDFIRMLCSTPLNACLGTGKRGNLPAMNPSICRTLSTICFQGGILSILLSIWIWWFLNGDSPEEQAHAERFGIFIGLWAPTLLILSNLFDRYADKARNVPGLNEEKTKENA